MPEPKAAGKILHRRGQSTRQHPNAAGRERYFSERAGGYRGAREHLAPHDLTQPAEVGFQSRHLRPIERPAQRLHRGVAICRRDDDLREQRVVVSAHFAARGDPGFDARGGRKLHVRDRAAARTVLLRGILGIQASLNRTTGRRIGHPRPGGEGVEKGSLAGRTPQHPFDQIDAGDLLGDAVLHLQPGVHFQEIEPIAARIEDELDGSGGAIGDGAREAQRRVDHPGARSSGESGGGSLLEHLLIAALQGAVPLAQRNHPPGAIAEDLYFDMARIRYEALQVDGVVVEVAAGKPRHQRVGFFERRGVLAHPHADPATSGCRLQHDRKSDTRGRDSCCRQVPENR